MRDPKLTKSGSGADSSLMDRRGFLIRGGSVMLILPVGWSIAGCSDNNDNNNVVPPPTQQMGGTLLFHSSITENHSHDFTIDMTEVSSPPAAGISRSTSASSSPSVT